MQKKWVILSSSAGALVIVLGVVAFMLFGQNNPVVKKIAGKFRATEDSEKKACPLDGLPTSEEKANAKPLGVMVENMSTIRPQSGLSKACIVVEALAEGGITRFLVIFNHRDAKSIGPVRSARPYYVAVAKGFNAVYAHVGGSTVGLQKIKEYAIDDLDQFKFASAYWRQSGRRAPHNFFTSTKKLRTESEKAGLTDASYDPFKFGDKKLDGKKASDIRIAFSSKAYNVQYKYDKKSNTYKRFNGGIKHVDANNNKQISPANIIVLRANTSALEGETLNIDIIGSGKGYLFRNGKYVAINWNKESASSQISFTDENDEEVKLTAGQIWVEIVKSDTKVEVQ